MNKFPVLALANAVRSHARAFVEQHPAAWRSRRAQLRQELVTVTVAGRDALLVRRAVLTCAGAAVVNCIPMHRQDKVRLEIRFPAGGAGQVIEQILAAVPAGEIGCVIRCTPTLARRAQRRV